MLVSGLVSGNSVTKVGGSIQSVVSKEKMELSGTVAGSRTWEAAGSVMVKRHEIPRKNEY